MSTAFNISSSSHSDFDFESDSLMKSAYLGKAT